MDDFAAEGELRHLGVNHDHRLQIRRHDSDLVIRRDGGLPMGAVHEHVVGPVLGGQGVDRIRLGLHGRRAKGLHILGQGVDIALRDAEVPNAAGDADAQVRGLDAPQGHGAGNVARAARQLGRPGVLSLGCVKVEDHIGVGEDVGRRLVLLDVHHGERTEGRFHIPKRFADQGPFRGRDEGVLGPLRFRAGQQTAAQQHRQQ